jgi:uncharacterized protein YrrD
MTAPEAGQRIDTGDDVIGSEGEKLGRVEYLVVDPPELNITDIVVSTGAILGRDIVVPIDKVERVSDAAVHLSVDKSQLAALPNYVDVKFQVPPEAWVPPAGFYYPPSAVLWPAEYYAPPTEVKVNAPAGTVGMHDGMDVESSDGHKVGSINGFDVGPEDDVTAIVVKSGFIFTHDARIPVQFISDVDDGKVRLNLTKDEVERRFEGKAKS